MESKYQDSETNLVERDGSMPRESIDDDSSAGSETDFDYTKSARASWTRHVLRRSRFAKTSFTWVALVMVFLLTSAFWSFLIMLWQSGLLPVPANYGAACYDASTTSMVPYDMGRSGSIFSATSYIDCGESTEEAQAKGCVYDILANHYVHTSCYDEIGAQSYMDEGTSWIGYADANQTMELTTIEEMGEYDTYWTSKRDHIVHCGEMWKRQYRAFAQNWRFIDAITANEEHTYHCADFLVAMTDWDVIAGRNWREEPNTVEVGFAGCWDRASSAERRD